MIKKLNEYIFNIRLNIIKIMIAAESHSRRIDSYDLMQGQAGHGYGASAPHHQSRFNQSAAGTHPPGAGEPGGHQCSVHERSPTYTQLRVSYQQ